LREIRKLAALVLLTLMPALAVAQQSSAASVNALLFFQPFCDQCFAVIDNFLVPITQEQGEGLRLEPVDLSTPDGLALYQNALQGFGLPADEGVRPALVVGNEILRGEEEILGRFPELLDQGLLAGGIALPDLPGLAAFIEGDEMPAPVAEDGLAMGLAWAVFVILVMSLGYAGKQMLGGGIFGAPGTRALVTIWIPLLALIGLGISGYLSYVELGLGEAACGPVGDCNRVQSSPYSKILGIPMAFLGSAYYAALMGLWGVQRQVVRRSSVVATRLLIAGCVLGAFFSLYLTSLELFVIHAVCMWCLGSALVTALLTVVATSAKPGTVSPLANSGVGTR
jgi:uncharacterized membrane protein